MIECACNLFKGDHRYDTVRQGTGSRGILEFCTGAGMHDKVVVYPIAGSTGTVSGIGKAKQGKGYFLMPLA